MVDRLPTYIPPLAISRMIGTYHFEGGGYVAIVAHGSVPAEMLVDKAQALLDLKRVELAASAIEAAAAGETQGGSTEGESVIGEAETPQPTPPTQEGPR